MKTYELEYDFTTLATVNIDEEKAAPAIKEMVEFWMGWEDAVDANDGDYTKTWLKSLAKFILHNHRLPSDDEGWVPLDETFGILVTRGDTWRPDDDMISIEDITTEER